MSKKQVKLTPMLKQFMSIKEKHPDKLLLFRMGDFYETFFDDAKIAAKILGITLTARNKNAENSVPLAGFPYHALDNYLDKIVKQGLKVVICEQVEDPKLAKGLVKREIVDIITPGSVIDDKLIDQKNHNFLATIATHPKYKKIGFSFIDASTGDFEFTELDWEMIADELMRIQPREIVVENKDIEIRINDLNLEIKPAITTFDSWFYDREEAQNLLKKHFHVQSLEAFGPTKVRLGKIAAGVALAYLISLKKDDLKHITSLQFYSLDQYMQIDETSRRNLELMRSMRYGTSFGSLLSVIDHTKTPMGSRLLQKWLLKPLLDQKEIEKRLLAVQTLLDNFAFTEDLRAILDSVGDLSRIIAKVGSKRVNPRDLIALKKYLTSAPQLQSILQEFSDIYLQELTMNIHSYQSITDLIGKAIIEEAPLTIQNGNIINPGFHQELDELREISANGKSWIAKLETEERKKTEIPSLKIGYNRVFGYYIEVTKTHKDKVPEYYIRKQTLVNAERFISPQLKEYESKVLGAEERIKNLEYEIFVQIRDELADHVNFMQQFVEVVSQLDVLSTNAYNAYKNNYCKPEFNSDGYLEIKDSRHPVIEQIMQNESFIENDVFLNDTDHKIVLITGPNMAGKSTYLRQVGLLVLLAQMGSFVPAKAANLPIFDKVFTRVGASDNLAMGQSTFLVEMLETANILHSSTPNSLILLDEIGRGTSTFDGLSLAWSIVEYLHNNKKISAKTLFATHYHELTELENILNGVKNYNIAVKEWNDNIIFVRKIKRGAADQSYGIQVARLAGVPQKVISRAKQILRNLEEHELSPQGLTAKLKKQLARSSEQMDIFDVIVEKASERDDLLEEIRQIDIENLTPIQAMQKLVQLKEKL